MADMIPILSEVLSGLGGVASSIIAYAEKVIDWTKSFVEKTIDIINALTQTIIAYVNIFFGSFPFDDPKKTMLLSFLWFIGLAGIIMIFGNWESGPVNAIDGNKISYQIDMIPGNQQIEGAANGTMITIPTPVTPPSAYSCYTDDDCVIQIEAGEKIRTKCCLNEKYEGFSCAGRCLKNMPWAETEDACKLPNACILPEDYTVKLSGCLEQNDPNQYCKTYGSESLGINPNSVCCSDTYTPCYGYCLLPNGISCFDPTDCYNEQDAIVYLVEGGDI